MQPPRISTQLALGAVLFAGLGAGVTPAEAQELPVYHVTRLADMVEEVFPGVTFPSSHPQGLNENGDMVGEAWLNSNPGSVMQAFVYTVEHGVTALPLVPGWPSNAVRDVSERDENGEIIIVGGGVYGVQVDVAIGVAALWRFSTVTGEVLETRAIPTPLGFDDGLAVAVNNDGIVVGFSELYGPFANWKYDVATHVLETFDFPARVKDLNNVGQICGGSYRGDLFGNYEDLTDIYEPGDVMPDWAIENGGISAGWNRINDLGWVVGRAGTGISDGTGHYLVAIVRYADPIGWTGLDPCCWASMPGGINDLGDFEEASGGVYLEEMGSYHSINTLLAEEFYQLVSVGDSPEINNNRQIIGSQAHALLLTPIGEMIIPGDVNGDVSVDLDDHCAWLADPIDLNDDGVVDGADEQWLFDRLAVFGFTIEDCNGNGANDHCDILDGLSNDCDGNDAPDECQADCSGDGVPDVCEPDCNDNGTPDPCDIQQDTSEDCNGNGVPDECDEGWTIEVMHVWDPPIDLIANTTFVHDINVFDTGIVGDVDFTFDIHYRIGYLSAMLSHNGTTITLLDRPGFPDDASTGNGQLGYDIILDDEGTGGAIENQGNFGSPFTQITSPPSYTPDDPLSAFDGMPMEGVWTVHVVTLNYHPAHTFDDWGLTITSAAVPVDPENCVGGPGDANRDGSVNVEDLVMVFTQWGPCPEPPNACDADVDGNGIVDVNDMLMVVLNWG